MAGIYVTYMYFKGIVEVYKNIHAHVNATIQMVCCPTEVGVWGTNCNEETRPACNNLHTNIDIAYPPSFQMSIIEDPVHPKSKTVS